MAITAPLAKSFSGTGEILGFGHCDFVAGQRFDGTVIIECTSELYLPLNAGALSIVGTTTSGAQFRGSGARVSRLSRSSAAPTTHVRLLADSIEVGASTGASALRYGLTN